MISAEALEDLKRRTDIVGVIQPLAELRKAGHSWVGPCPFCGGGKRSSRFEVKPRQQRFMCAVCHEGGDVIRFVQLMHGLSFREAIDHLGGGRELDDTARKKLAQRAAAREREEVKSDEKAILRAREIWDAGQPLLSSPAAAYFEARGIPLAPSEQPLSLRFVPSLDYWHQAPASPPESIHRGPALLAAITREGEGGKPEFRGCHCTYLSTDCRSKLDLGERNGEPLKAKKIRGRAGGGAIRMTPPAESGLLLIGEGIETTRTVLLALRAKGVAAGAWAGVSLGNMAGGSLGRGEPHPEKQGLWIPSQAPDMERPGLLPPAWAKEIILLGDGDSDPLMTRARLTCAAWRFSNLGHRVRTAWARDGMDFNDMVRP